MSNGAKITVDSGFKSLYDNSRQNVFKISGEVPITGEASQALTRGRTQGGFRGGFASRFAGGGTHHLEKMLYELKGKVKGYIRYGSSTRLDPLSVCFASLNNLPEDWRNFVYQTSNGSPLQLPFYWSVIPENVLSSLQPGSASDLAAIREGGTRNLTDEFKARRSSFSTLNRNNIVDVLLQAEQRTCDASPHQSTLGSNAASWMLAKDEFCYINRGFFNHVYSGQSGEPGAIKTLHNLHNLVLKALIDKNWDRARHLTGSAISNSSLQSVEIFCARLALLTSCCSFSGFKQSDISSQMSTGQTRPDSLQFNCQASAAYASHIANKS